MKQFFKFVLATIVGVILSSIVIVIIVAAIIGGLIASAGSEKTVDVEPNSVLRMAFTAPITERTPNNPLAGLSFLGLDKDKSTGLNDILANIKKAKADPNIKGIFLDESYMVSGQATTEEIGRAHV